MAFFLFFPFLELLKCPLGELVIILSPGCDTISVTARSTLVPGNSMSTKTDLLAGYIRLAPSSPLGEYNEESYSCCYLPADMPFQTFA